ncbi:hypothetical protein SRABI82_05104 [Priestia megaterium]|nr:hypothetical protein SRABI82_05104 [Priestia megaterium]
MVAIGHNNLLVSNKEKLGSKKKPSFFVCIAINLEF